MVIYLVLHEFYSTVETLLMSSNLLKCFNFKRVNIWKSVRVINNNLNLLLLLFNPHTLELLEGKGFINFIAEIGL